MLIFFFWKSGVIGDERKLAKRAFSKESRNIFAKQVIDEAHCNEDDDLQCWY